MNKLYKYPRTPHLPFSEGATDDDKILKSTEHFLGKEVVVTEKMDGENTTIYNDNYHARSLDSTHREYHSYLLSRVLPQIQYQIPDGIRICGEYLYAKHSIYYDNLTSYFQVFSVWNNDTCFSWNDTKDFISKLGLIIVPELYVGIYSDNKMKELAKEVITRGGEGIVVRFYDSYKYEDFGKSVAKYVRPHHVQTDTHWSQSEIITNTLKE